MNPIVFHIAGGDAFFSGTGCILAAVALGFHRKSWVRQCATLLTIIGLLLVTVSATPLPYWYYGIAGVISIGWVIVIRPEPPVRNRRRLIAVIAATVWLAGVGMELQYRFTPTVEYESQPVVVYGDSVTAGLGEGEADTWPTLLKRQHNIDIRDFSRVGAKVDTVIRIIERHPEQKGIALLEIGGNDLLGSTTVADFDRNLNRLLGLLSQRHHIVVMFELPLLPFTNEYGRVQRRLAAKHGVLLIPKRVLMGVLADDGATLDSIHLTQSGHDRMAKVVLRVLGRID